MTNSTRFIALALSVAAAGSTTAAAAQPTGVWIDHTGRGAVEIAECAGGNGLCGHVVWVKDGKNKSACRTQIIGNAKPVGGNTWDRGWIIDPDDNARYSVELKPMGEDRLRVTGYMGSKLFSETMIWKRAPAQLERCDNRQTAAPAPSAPAAAPASAPASVSPSAALPPASAPQPAHKPAESSPFEPVSPAPAPQREAAAPTAPPPPAGTPAPPLGEPAAAPAAQPSAAPQTAEGDPEDQPKPRRGSNGKRKTASKECRLELPYVTLKYPCDAF